MFNFLIFIILFLFVLSFSDQNLYIHDLNILEVPQGIRESGYIEREKKKEKSVHLDTFVVTFKSVKLDTFSVLI